MADDDDAMRDGAPDLKILGNEITLQPSGVEESEEALMKSPDRFRQKPLEYALSDSSLLFTAKIQC